MPVFAAPRHFDAVDGEPPGGVSWLAVRVWLSRARLDRELAEGANPTTDRERALRAQQLVSPRSRRALARGLRRLVTQARQPPRSQWDATIGVNRHEVMAASDLLLSLADRLEEVASPCPRAVALASFLLCDPMSPANGMLRARTSPLAAEEHATTAQLARAALEAVDTHPLT